MIFSKSVGISRASVSQGDQEYQERVELPVIAPWATLLYDKLLCFFKRLVWIAPPGKPDGACGLHGASEDDFARQLARDGARPSWRLGAFEDVEVALRHELARLRSAPELPLREHIRGFVFDP